MGNVKSLKSSFKLVQLFLYFNDNDKKAIVSLTLSNYFHAIFNTVSHLKVTFRPDWIFPRTLLLSSLMPKHIGYWYLILRKLRVLVCKFKWPSNYVIVKSP